jgi:hypothetical protein
MHYIKNISLFLTLCLTIGFPRIYGTEIPMAFLLAPFFIVGFIQFVFKKSIFCFIYLILFLSGFFLGIFSYINGSGGWQDLFFHIVIYFKILLVVFFAYVVYRCIYKNPSILFHWILFQFFVVVLSIFSKGFYRILLGFISPRSAEVFQHIFGLRALGFGLFHVDGSITLVFAVFLYVLIINNGEKKSSIFALLVSLPVSMSVARSALIPYLMFGIFTKGYFIKFMFLLVMIVMFITSVFVEFGPLYQASEIFRNIISGKGIYSDSVASLFTMYSLPKELSTYIIGDGMYYSETTGVLSFYMGTDVGYMRILYYSGVFSIIIFIVINAIFSFVGIFASSGPLFLKYRIYFLVSIFVFFIMNAKGIQVAPFFSLVAFYYIFNTTLAPANAGTRG